MSTDRDPGSWQDPHREGVSPELLAPSTQVAASAEAYLGQGARDVGRRISEDQVELFINIDVASALQQEFTLHQPAYLALHDIGASASLRLLTSLAGAAGARVQRLTVRRQGHGVAIATVQFVEMPQGDGSRVRVYSTDLNADSQARVQLARVLLAHSSLGVLLVGELPPHALTAQLAPLHDMLVRGPWPNRELLVVPLGSGTALAAQAAHLAEHSPVSVHVTPNAAQPRQAWGYISGAWNRLHQVSGQARMLAVDMESAVAKPVVPMSEAETQPMALDSPIAAPSVRAAAAAASPAPGQAAVGTPAPAAARTQGPTPMPVPGATQWQTYANRCTLIKGCTACCVLDLHSMRSLAFAGGPPTAERLAQHGVTLLLAANEASRGLGLGPVRTEASVSTASHHLLLRPVRGHPGVAVHLVLLATASNLTLARMQLERVESPT